MDLNSKIADYNEPDFSETLYKEDLITKPRTYFSDDKNSLMHFIFGVSSSYQPIIIPIFLGYQLLAQKKDVQYSLVEYGSGYVLGRLTK